MQYTLKEFAKMFNVTEHTIRYYTDIGLLPCQRNSSNRRVFDENSVNRMQTIICLKRCGASIETIKEYCQLCNLEQSKEHLNARYQIILKQRDESYNRLKEAKTTVEYIERKVKFYEDIPADLKPDSTNPNNRTTNKPQ